MVSTSFVVIPSDVSYDLQATSLTLMICQKSRESHVFLNGLLKHNSKSLQEKHAFNHDADIVNPVLYF